MKNIAVATHIYKSISVKISVHRIILLLQDTFLVSIFYVI